MKSKRLSLLRKISVNTGGWGGCIFLKSLTSGPSLSESTFWEDGRKGGGTVATGEGRLQRSCKLQILKPSPRHWVWWSLCVFVSFFQGLRVYTVLKKGPWGPLQPAVSHPKLLPFQPEQGGLMHWLPGSKSNSIPLSAICLRLPHAYFMISGTFPPYLTSCNASLCCLYYFYLW